MCVNTFLYIFVEFFGFQISEIEALFLGDFVSEKDLNCANTPMSRYFVGM